MKLPEILSSTTELKAVIMELREYRKWVGQASVKMALGNKQPDDHPELSEAAIGLVNQAVDRQPVNPKILDKLLEDLEDYLETAPHISITLAAPASKKLKQALMDWCRTNINADILVDFGFNSSLLGGLVVRYGSHIYDWSFKRQLMANLSKFPEVLRRV